MPPLLKSTLAISLTDVNNGGGFMLNANDGLEDFIADATANIGAEPIIIPEPSGITLGGLGILALLALRRRR